MRGPTLDAVLTLGLVLLFGTLATAHVATLFGLLRRRQPGAALAGLVLPPLAPYLAFTRGMRARAVTWIASAALYGAALVLAR